MSDEVKLCYSFRFKDHIFETWNDFPSMNFLQVKQVHSAEVLDVDRDDFSPDMEADGIVSFSQTHPALAIKTADCLPIAIIGKKGVGNVHAGWRGLHKKILSHPLIRDLEPIQFIVGPHISAANYEVGPEFREYFNSGISLEEYNEKLVFSQKKEVLHQLDILFPGVPVEMCRLCTWDEPDLHSYRREKGSGRNVSVLRKV